MKISGSILAADFANLEKEINRVKEYMDYIHIDIMDGNFVPNISFGPYVTRCVKNIIDLPLDVHLMVKNPLDIIDEFIKLQPEYITVHYETINDKLFEKIYTKLKENNIKIGISINPETPYEVLIPYLEKVDLILIMSVNPGYCGQTFIEDVIYKIDMLREIIDSEKSNVKIEVDGGINNSTIEKVTKSDIIVLGSYLFNESDKEILNKYKQT